MKDVPSIKDSYNRNTFIVELHAVHHYVVEENTPKTLLEEFIASWGHYIYQYWKTDEGFEELKRKSPLTHYTSLYAESIMEHIKGEQAANLSNVISIEEWKNRRTGYKV